MGAGVCQVSIDKGMKVIMKDTNVQGLARGEEMITKGLSTMVKKKKLSRYIFLPVLNIDFHNINPITNYSPVNSFNPKYLEDL